MEDMVRAKSAEMLKSQAASIQAHTTASISNNGSGSGAGTPDMSDAGMSGTSAGTDASRVSYNQERSEILDDDPRARFLSNDQEGVAVGDGSGISWDAQAILEYSSDGACNWSNDEISMRHATNDVSLSAVIAAAAGQTDDKVVTMVLAEDSAMSHLPTSDSWLATPKRQAPRAYDAEASPLMDIVASFSSRNSFHTVPIPPSVDCSPVKGASSPPGRPVRRNFRHPISPKIEEKFYQAFGELGNVPLGLGA